MLDTLFRFAVFGLAVYLVLVGFVYLTQARLLYLPQVPSREVDATPADIGVPYESVTLRTADGVHLDGWYVPADRTRGELLFLHGNAGNIGHRLDSIRVFHDLGLGVLIFDYRGYGRSEGRPTEEGTYADAEAAWDYLVDERGTAPGSIVVFGRSLGGAIAAKLAAEHRPAAVILESTFTSVPDLAAELYTWLPVRALSRFRYPAERYLADVDSPVMVIHSPQDEIVPIAHGRRLFAAAGQPREFLRLRGGHNVGFLITGEAYAGGIDAFLRKHL